MLYLLVELRLDCKTGAQFVRVGAVLLASDGDSALGGQDVTFLLVNYCMQKCRESNNGTLVDFAKDVGSSLHRSLYSHCKEAKELLSRKEKVRISVKKFYKKMY